MFPTSRGTVWTDFDWRNWRRRVYRPTAEAVGLTGSRPYDLRHSFASLLIHEGVSVLEVDHPVAADAAAGHATADAAADTGADTEAEEAEEAEQTVVPVVEAERLVEGSLLTKRAGVEAKGSQREPDGAERSPAEPKGWVQTSELCGRGKRENEKEQKRRAGYVRRKTGVKNVFRS